MAAAATDWLDLSRAKRELRINEAIGDHDLTLLAHIEDAVAFLSERAELPLLDSTREIPGIAPRVPLRIPATAYLLSVDALHYRTARNLPYASRLMPGDAPVLERCTPARMTEWRFWPDVVLPDEAHTIRLTIKVGMDPDDPAHRHIRWAVVLLVREAWDGQTIAEKMPAWERIVRSFLVAHAPNWRE